MFGAKTKLTNESGFTLIELLVVIGIIVVLFALGTLNLGMAHTTTSLTSATNTLLANIKNQQILSMSGDSGGKSTQQPHGIYFQANSYVLFAGTVFDATDTNNLTINADPVTISTTFPSTQAVFAKGSGALLGYSVGNNTITISVDGSSKTITVNRFGATTVN